MRTSIWAVQFIPSLLFKSINHTEVNQFRGFACRAAAIALLALMNFACLSSGASGPQSLWTDKYKGTQIEAMEAVDVIVDNAYTYTLGNMDLANGEEWAVVLKYDNNKGPGNDEAVLLQEKLWLAAGDTHTRSKDFVMDSNGDLVIAGKRGNAETWFVTKLDGNTLDIIWDTTWSSDGNSDAYTLAVGPSGDVYVGGFYGKDRFATAKFDATTGAKEWDHKIGCCFNGVIKDKSRWDSLVVTDNNGDEWLYITHAGSGGLNSNPSGMDIRWYKGDNSVQGSQGINMDSNASDYKLMLHPDGYIVMAGNQGSTVRVKRLNFGSSGLASVSDIINFSINFTFRAMAADADGALYISGDTGSGSNTNAYLAKYDPSCVSGPNTLCWDHTFNHSNVFNLSVSLLGIPIIETFSQEEVKDLLIVDDLIYMLTSSLTSDMVIENQHVTELVGYNRDTGASEVKVQIQASDTAGAAVSPTNPTAIHVTGVNTMTLGGDPDIYLYTRAIMGL